MSFGLSIRREAEADLAEAFRYYESCRPGLGQEFLMCVEAALSAIQRQPSRFRVVHATVMRAMMHRFPYGIYFIVRDQKVIVLAVMHARRAPSNWQGRSQV